MWGGAHNVEKFPQYASYHQSPLCKSCDYQKGQQEGDKDSQAVVKSHVFVTEMAKILAAKQQKVPIKDNVVVKNSKHAKRMAAFHRKQEEDAQQTMPMANNIAFVGPTKAEVNEWFHDKKEKQEEAEYIYQAFKAWHKFSPDEAPPPECFYVSISNGYFFSKFAVSGNN
ncbi:unnamed protein product [Cylindrotheca closterium]|uniref:Uncharacterized protein n=1 Tax=Cylindrotheca closterium TaxID=2856 RepID=A0AAD2CM99_9STRA|nr:unnamed protein product [Cylindrotheca closterium]